MDRIMAIKNKVHISEWSEMVRPCRSSGLTVQQWCNSNGINIKTYYYRLRKVREALCEDTHVYAAVIATASRTFCPPLPLTVHG